MKSETSYSVRVKLPAEAFRHHPWEPDAIAKQLKTLWLLELVRERRLGYGKAAELADMSKASFIALMGRHQISPFDFEPDELEAELAAANVLANS